MVCFNVRTVHCCIKRPTDLLCGRRFTADSIDDRRTWSFLTDVPVRPLLVASVKEKAYKKFSKCKLGLYPLVKPSNTLIAHLFFFFFALKRVTSRHLMQVAHTLQPWPFSVSAVIIHLCWKSPFYPSACRSQKSCLDSSNSQGEAESNYRPFLGGGAVHPRPSFLFDSPAFVACK